MPIDPSALMPAAPRQANRKRPPRNEPQDHDLAALMVAALAGERLLDGRQAQSLRQEGQGRGELAGEGQRISIIAADQVLAPAEALKGVDFALPPVETVAGLAAAAAARPSSRSATPSAGKSLERRLAQELRASASKRGRYVTAPPVAADGKVFLLDADARVVAVDARTGGRSGASHTNPGDNKRDRLAFGGGVAYSDGKLYVVVRLPRGAAAGRQDRRGRLAGQDRRVDPRRPTVAAGPRLRWWRWTTPC
jgi:hypothetical protein